MGRFKERVEFFWNFRVVVVGDVGKPSGGKSVDRVSVIGHLGMGWEEWLGKGDVFDGERPPFVKLTKVLVPGLGSSDACFVLEMEEQVKS